MPPSGKHGNDHRPELAKALERARKAKAPIIVAKLDRLIHLDERLGEREAFGPRQTAAGPPSLITAQARQRGAGAQSRRRVLLDLKAETRDRPCLLVETLILVIPRQRRIAFGA
jgi:hypothetical protein